MILTTEEKRTIRERLDAYEKALEEYYRFGDDFEVVRDFRDAKRKLYDYLELGYPHMRTNK